MQRQVIRLLLVFFETYFSALGLAPFIKAVDHIDIAFGRSLPGVVRK